MATEAIPAEMGLPQMQEALEGRAERRGSPRFPVDCSAEVLLLTAVSRQSGKMLNLSMSGCRIETEQPFVAGVLARVEVQFQLRGMAFRLVGVTAGTRSSRSFAIRFLEMSRSRQEELAEVIGEVEAIEMAKAAKVSEAARMAEAAMRKAPEASADFQALEKASPDAVNPADADKRDRRAHLRHRVDSRAKLFLVKTAILMEGRVQNLSLGGCCLRTHEPFNVGIFVRVETEFYVHGIAFRVGGVIQTILDKNTVGIRFLDMSERRREQLMELMGEIAEPAR